MVTNEMPKVKIKGSDGDFFYRVINGNGAWCNNKDRLAQLRWIQEQIASLTLGMKDRKENKNKILNIYKQIDKELVSDSQVNRLPSTPSDGSVQEGEK